MSNHTVRMDHESDSLLMLAVNQALGVLTGHGSQTYASVFMYQGTPKQTNEKQQTF